MLFSFELQSESISRGKHEQKENAYETREFVDSGLGGPLAILFVGNQSTESSLGYERDVSVSEGVPKKKFE